MAINCDCVLRPGSPVPNCPDQMRAFNQSRPLLYIHLFVYKELEKCVCRFLASCHRQGHQSCSGQQKVTRGRFEREWEQAHPKVAGSCPIADSSSRSKLPRMNNFPIVWVSPEVLLVRDLWNNTFSKSKKSLDGYSSTRGGDGDAAASNVYGEITQHRLS
ncbi:hypothetical protein CDL15_Pgr003876 [Punica granatum]|uniref:Uncharacterized protein n=1 Tax=Punica granatum TaxID=22663 RepID=A0A218XU45_PUNGR|nr:hypothetical protein CDL15_Pgr003876 [Punica granatum]